MKITKIERNNNVCAVVNSSEKIITDVQSALELLMTVNYEAETKILQSAKN